MSLSSYGVVGLVELIQFSPRRCPRTRVSPKARREPFC